MDIAAAVATLRSLANPARLQIALRLLQGEAAVSTLERELGLRQPNLSQHLGELRDAGLVLMERDGRSVIYRLANDGCQRLVSALAASFGGALPKAVREQPPSPVTRRQAHLGAMFAVVAGVE